jgi:anti-anti-sigma factor
VGVALPPRGATPTVVDGVPGRLVGDTEEADHAPITAPERLNGRCGMTLSIAHSYPADGQVVLALRGTLDRPAATGLHAAITTETQRMPRPSCIVVDLHDVDHVDPAAVGSLVAGNRVCAVAGIHLAVRGPSPLVRGLLRLRASGGEQAPACTQPADRDRPAWHCTPRRTPAVRRQARTGGCGPPGRAAVAAGPRRGR